MAKKSVNKLGTEKIGNLLIRLSLPAIIAQFVNMLYNIVDRIYIGHISNTGATALTGIGITFPIIMIIAAFSSLVGMGGAPQAAIKMGQGKYDEAEQILGNCFITLIGISMVLTVSFLSFGENLLMAFGAGTDTLPYALKFFNTYVCGTIFVQIVLGLNPFIGTQGFAKISMLTAIIGGAISIVLDPIFIFGFGMGVQGAATANVIAQAVSAIWTLNFLFGNKTKLKIRKKYMRVQKSVMVSVLLLGISPFIMQSTESLLNITFNTSLKTYGGDIEVGAMTILSSLMQVLMLPIVGLAQGAQPITSYNFGAQNNERVKKTFKLLIISALSCSFTLWTLMILFPTLFVSLFSNDPRLVGTTVWAMRIYMAIAFIMGAQHACQQTFIAIGQAKTSLFLALLRKIILLIPIIHFIPLFFTNKVFAVFLAEPISDAMAVTVTLTLFSKQFKKILGKNTSMNNVHVG